MARMIHLVLVVSLAGVADVATAASPPLTPASHPPANPGLAPNQLILWVATGLQLPLTLTPADRGAAAQIVGKLRAGEVQGANAEWGRLTDQVARRRDGTNPHMVLAWILRQVYLEGNVPLRDAADRVRLTQEAQSVLAQHLATVRQQAAGATDAVPLPLSVVEVSRFQPGQRTLLAWRQARLTKAEFLAYQQRLEGQLRTTGELGQLAQVELQKCYQDYQQAVQTLASIQKLLHDTAMTVIGNLRS